MSNTKPVECAITTIDNPYDPFEQFVLWDLFDKEKGYNANQKVARLLNIDESMTEREMLIECERAIDRLIEIDFTNTYVKVRRNSKQETN